MITSGVRDVCVSPATEKMHTHLRNMPHGIAGETPTSLVLARDNVQSLMFKA